MTDAINPVVLLLAVSRARAQIRAGAVPSIAISEAAQRFKVPAETVRGYVERAMIGVELARVLEAEREAT